MNVQNKIRHQGQYCIQLSLTLFQLLALIGHTMNLVQTKEPKRAGRPRNTYALASHHQRTSSFEVDPLKAKRSKSDASLWSRCSYSRNYSTEYKNQSVNQTINQSNS
jgi:hypothetical protein